MAYINFLDTIGTIGNKEVCLSIIKSRARDGRIRNLSDHQLAMEINGNHRKSEDRFFSKEYREYPEYESRVYYLWINTGIKHKEHNEDIYVQFARSKGDWQGGHVGTESEIIRGFLKTARPDQIREDLRMSTEGLFGIKGNILEDITTLKMKI